MRGKHQVGVVKDAKIYAQQIQDRSLQYPVNEVE